MNYNPFFIRTAFCIVLLSLLGCDNELENFPNDLSQSRETEKHLISSKKIISNLRSLSYDTWQQQLDNLVKGGSEFNYIYVQGLNLIDFQLMEQETIYKVTPIAPTSLIAFYNDGNNVNKFSVMPMSEVELVNPRIKSTLNDLKINLLRDFSEEELRSVKLTWSYNGNTFETISWVTQESIIYDDILSSIRIVSVERESSNSFSQSRLKNGVENEGNQNIRYEFSDKVEMNSWSGSLKARASFSMNIQGTRSNGKQSISTFAESRASNADNGYSASASVVVNSHKSGEDGFVDFSYGLVVGYSGVYLGWDGFNFTIIGPSESESAGRRLVNPSMLN